MRRDGWFAPCPRDVEVPIEGGGRESSVLSGALLSRLRVAPWPALSRIPPSPFVWSLPFLPGAWLTSFGRLLAERLAKQLGQPVVVDNRPGAGGTIGTASVAKAAPDGYTLLMAVSSQMVLEPLLNPNVSYDSERDFLGVAAVSRLPFFLVVPSTLGPKTVQEFVSLVRSKPGTSHTGQRGGNQH